MFTGDNTMSSISSALPAQPNLAAAPTHSNEAHAVSPHDDGNREANARSVTERVPINPPVMLKAGMSMPANLGQDIDRTV